MKGIRKRPYTPVYFTGSTLSLESLSYDIRLTNGKVVIFDEEKFNKVDSIQNGSLVF